MKQSIQKSIENLVTLVKAIRFIPIAYASTSYSLTELYEDLVKLSKLLESGVKLHNLHRRYVRLEVPWIKVMSPVLSFGEALKLSGFLLQLHALLKLGATLDVTRQIISLNFYPGSPKFKIDLWSDMYEALYIYYAERLFSRIFIKNNITLKDATVIDIGGYIGDTAIFFALEGANSVFSFEPHPMLFELLKTNIALNRMENTITPYKLAIGDSSKIIPLRLPSNKYRAYRTLGITSWSNSPISSYAQQVAFEEILSKFDREDIVKFNCEGCEYPSILSSSIETLRKIKYLVMHLHEYEQFQHSRINLLKLLRKINFRLLEQYGPEYFLFINSKY